MLSVVLACTSSSTISLVASNDIFTSGVFCQGTQANSSQSLDFIFVIWKNLLNKQSICSRFIMKVVLWRGHKKNNQWTIWIVDVFFVHMHKLLNKQFSFNQWNFILRVRGIKSILLTTSSDAKAGFHFPLLLTWKPVEQTAHMIQNI